MSDANPWLLARANLRYFTLKFLGLEWHKHWSEWEKLILVNQRLLVQAPRGSRKSWFFSLAYPIWRILREKTEVLLVSDSEDQARKSLRLIRAIVETQDALAPMRPSTKELWGVDQVTFANGSLVSIMGFGTSKRGTHPDIIVNDDIESENNKMSREDKDRMYYGVITGMALPHTQIVTVGTPMQFGDLLAQLEQNKAYAKWARPAVENGVNQFPDLWQDDWLMNFRREEMGSINYAREMLLQRIDPATQPFKSEFLREYDETPDNFARIVTVCDPAYTEGDGDATAIVTVGFTHGNHAYVLEAKELRKEDAGSIVSELFKTIGSYEPGVVGIEKRKGDAISYSFEERRTRENRWDFQYVELKHGGASKGTRMSMVGGLIPRWEARTVHLHKSQKKLAEQLYQFRFDNLTKGHDDLVDALAYCFHPDMSRPNTGKQHVRLPQNEPTTKGLYYCGRATESLKSGIDYGALLDRRVA